MAEPEIEIERLYNRFRRTTDGDAGAAATLALACVQLAGKPYQSTTLTVDQVAKRLGVSTWTVRQMLKRGTIVAARFGAGRGTLRFDPAHVDEVIAGRSQYKAHESTSPSTFEADLAEAMRKSNERNSAKEATRKAAKA